MNKIKVFSLGGLNENGKNLYVVEVDKKIFVFDAGLKYDNEHNLGVDYIIINMSNDSGIETVRTTIVDYISKASISKISKKFKVVILDECLEENETVRIGTLDNWKAVKLNQLEKNIDYPIVSFNMDTREFENDIGSIISDKEDEIYELELEDGSTIKVTGNHPFIVCDINNNIVERTINEGFEEGDKIVKYE